MQIKPKEIVVYVLLALLVLSLTGFGISSFGGSVRSLGKVGDTDIPIDGYVNALQQQRNALSEQLGRPVTMAEARQFGIDRSALQQVIAATALDNEAARIGLSVGDEQVRDQIFSFSAFQGPDGGFDRDAYEYILEQNGLDPASFEENLRIETARTLLQSAVLGGLDMPDGYGAAIYGYVAEQRSYVWAELTEADLPDPIPAPTDAQLSAFLTANTPLFTTPATRDVTYVLLAPDMLTADITLSEDELRAEYDARLDDFVIPESRLVARLVFPDADSAAAARARLDAGEVSFAALVEDRGLSLEDVDLGEVRRADLGAAGDAVFAAEGAAIIGPIDTDLGPALFQVNGILPAQETTFNEARAQIEADLRARIAADLVADEAEPIENLLAGGATLEEIADETRMAIGTATLTEDDATGLMSDPVFADAALALAEGDFPELLTLSDGRLAALRLDALTPPRLPDMAEIRDDLAAAWRAGERQSRLMARAEDLARIATETGAPFSTMGLRPATTSLGLTRDQVPDTAEAALAATAFALAPGATGAAAGGDKVYVLRLLDVIPADQDDQDGAFLRSLLAQQAGQGLIQDVIDIYAAALQAEAGLSLDQAAINGVNAQIQ